MDWQPIETAPKDGTEIDLWSPICKRIPDCKWLDRYATGWFTRGDRGWEEISTAMISPTHWMPLPAPPEK
jgi:hypothetical protein